ncbi:hypothetical protein [Catellatospora tritici]|uniref:hypothetical protein n=1 Tax=Catellatospora tritici TaxID=2851566 RepID=UPI001C2D2FED|nr:hypothetical protein [Catellatospora tritici]MBV1855096.1 hypothetical protein [Catellatospora tritici]
MTSEPTALDAVLRAAAQVRVTAPRAPGGDVPKGGLVLAVTEQAAVRRLIQALAVEQTTDGTCMCFGDLSFKFFDQENDLVATAGFHHASFLHWSGWKGLAVLRDGVAALRWLAEQGVDGPLAEHERRRRRYREQQLEEQRWRDDAPVAVRDLLDAALTASGTTGAIPAELTRLAIQRLGEALPDPVERTAATLAWYGSGSGRCSGYPVHESLPAPALAQTPIAHIIAALETCGMDERVVAGGVRHLYGSASRDHQAEDVATVPPRLRERLLAAARKSGDEDRLRRAQRWLSPRPQ